VPESVNRLYRNAGFAPPKGNKHVHPLRAHKAVVNYMKKGLSKSEAWRRVVGGMGKNAINKAHRKT